jgi:ADP-heptose:LPS heptosyltransferase
VSLQKEVREEDKKVLFESPIRHFEEYIHDFADTAALCELVDLVITVDTSLAHLAGSIGKKTWVLLPYVPDWRWLLNRSDSPWYDSMLLCRQKQDRQWKPVLKEINRDLLQLFK